MDLDYEANAYAAASSSLYDRLQRACQDVCCEAQTPEQVDLALQDVVTLAVAIEQVQQAVANAASAMRATATAGVQAMSQQVVQIRT